MVERRIQLTKVHTNKQETITKTIFIHMKGISNKGQKIIAVIFLSFFSNKIHYIML